MAIIEVSWLSYDVNLWIVSLVIELSIEICEFGVGAGWNGNNRVVQGKSLINH